ncbi:MAG: SUMF1/EgtB/PvdO family nonheme iron enzyme [Parvularculaceae bacterium]
MAQAVLMTPAMEPQNSRAAQIYAATANAPFAEKIAAALDAEGVEIVTGDYAASGAAAVIVVWSGASIGSKRLIEAARSPLTAGALIPVSIGRVEPPEGFRHLQPVDLAGWSGVPTDPRWRFVMDELSRIALLKAPASVPVAELAPEPGFESWFDAAFTDDVGRKPADALREGATVEGARPRAHAPAARLTHAQAPRRRLNPLVVTAAAGGAVVLLGLAALTSIRNAIAPKADNGAPPTAAAAPAPVAAIIAPVTDEPSGADSASGSPTAGPTPAAAPETALPPSAAEDRIAALIVENSAPEGQGQPDQLTVPAAGAAETAIFKDCADCPELSRIPAGAFRMGPGAVDIAKPGEGPALDVTIARPFAMARAETTVGEWALCVSAGACPALPGAPARRTPAVNVSWRDAQGYAAWLSKKTGHAYRLPSEAEWEYAARAGGDAPFSFGPAISASEASFDGSLPYRGEPGPILRGPKPVASYEPNAFGLYDMHGNAWEWTLDCWAASHAGSAVDGAPRGGECSVHVLKGGAWNTGGWRLRAAHRIGKPQNAREYDNGFRVVRELP